MSVSSDWLAVGRAGKFSYWRPLINHAPAGASRPELRAVRFELRAASCKTRRAASCEHKQSRAAAECQCATGAGERHV